MEAEQSVETDESHEKVMFIVGGSVPMLAPPNASNDGAAMDDNVFEEETTEQSASVHITQHSSSRVSTVAKSETIKTIQTGTHQVTQEHRSSTVQQSSSSITTEKSMTEESLKSQGQEKMQTFEEREQDFRDLFLTNNIMELSQNETLMTPPGNSGTVTPTRQVVGVEHLDNLVKLMEQLNKLRDDNAQLRKKVSYLEDTKALLTMRAEIAESKQHQHSTLDLSFHHQHSRAKSIISKQHSKIMQYLGTNTSSPVSVKTHQTLEKAISDSTQITVKSASHDETQSKQATSSKKLQSSRSMSVGSIEMVDLDLQTTVMELDTVKPPGTRNSSSKSLVFRRGEFKASKKLQEKWERVKKVFGSRPEGQIGSMTAEEIVKANRRSPTSTRPPSLTHMCSLDGSASPSLTVPMDRLKPDDRVLSRSNPQLTDQAPHTPSSTQSEPPSCGTHANSEDEEENTKFQFSAAVTATTHASSTSSTSEQRALQQQQQQQKRKTSESSSLSSSCSSLASNEVQYAFKNKPTNGCPEDNLLSVSSILKRRSSSPTLGSSHLTAELLGGDGSPRIGRSASFKVERSSSRGTNRMSESASVPSTPIVTEESQRKHSPFRTTDAHKKAKNAWGRVKNIIHNKKDLKLKKAKSSDDRDFETEITSTLTQGSLSDSNICLEDPGGMSDSSISKTLLSAHEAPTQTEEKGERTSPTLLRKLTQKAHKGPSPRGASPDARKGVKVSSPERSPPAGVSSTKRGSIAVAMASGSPADVMALMGVSEEYQRKMQEWEDKKKRNITKANSFAVDDSSTSEDVNAHKKEDVKYSEEFIRKMEEWEAKKGLTASPLLLHSSVEGDSHSGLEHSPQGACTPVGRAESSADITKLSESFTKRVQEWQRVKTKRVNATHTSPDGRSRQKRRHTTIGRSASLERAPRDRSSSQNKNDRELLTKIEKKENKIRRERQKLEKMKQKLQADVDGEQQGLSLEFIRRLREWEEMKGLTPSNLEVSSLEIQQLPRRTSSQKEVATPQRSISRERLLSDSALPLRDQREGLGQSVSAGNLMKPPKKEEKVGSNQEAKSPDARKFQEILAQKDEEISLLQDDVQQLTDRINSINKEHSEELANYRRELWASSKVGRFTIESDLMSASLRELDLQINYLQDYSHRLSREKRQLHMRVQEEARNRRISEMRLLEELKNVQEAIIKSGQKQTSVSEQEVMQCLYQYLTKANAQLSELKAGLSDRSRLLEEIERHLLVQEVTNKLLVADLQRREMEVQYLRDARKKAIIRRWRTYGGTDLMDRRKWTKPVLKRNNSSVLRQSFKRQSSCEQLCQTIHEIQQTSESSDATAETFVLPSDWLHQIQDYINRGHTPPEPSATGHPAAAETVSTSTQTVMTLCNYPHLPQAMMNVQRRDVGVSTVPPQPVPTASISSQTSLENLRADAMGAAKATHGGTVRKELFPEVASSGSKERQMSLPTDSFPKDQIDQLIKKYRQEDKTLSPEGKVSPEKSPVPSRRPKSGSLYSEWLKKEYKPPKLEYRKPQAAEKDTDSVFEPSTTALKEPSAELEAKPPQMPRSPIIRSKYPRKLRTTEARMQSLYDTESKAVWKATPMRSKVPARHHSKGSDKSPSSSSEAVSEEAQGRAHSDSCITQPQRLPPSPRLTKQYLSVDHQDTAPRHKGVLSMISRFEQINQAEQAPPTPTPRPLATSPLLPRGHKSPLAVSQVRRLKTAEELLNDSSKADPSSVSPREKIPSVSSDKENDKSGPRSRVLQMIQRFSVESSEGEQENSRSRSCSVERPVIRSTKSITSTPTSSPKPPLKDLTNESKSTASLQSSQPSSPKSIHQRNLEAKIEYLLSDVSQESKPEAAIPKSTSVSPQTSPLHMRSASKSSAPSTDSSTGDISQKPAPVWQLQAENSPKTEHRCLPKPGSPGKGSRSKGKGAISALCMQTMHLSGAQSLPAGTAPPGSPGGKEKKSKNKFLDGYKKLFKVTK